jgi:cytochrome c553
MNKILAALALAALPGALLAAPGDMNVATFLAKADALRAKGPAALFSSDVGLLRAEGTAAGEAYRARLARERAAGKPSSCPPKGTKVGQNELLAHLRAYPAGTRPSVTMKQAMADYFIKKYPCGS